MIRLFKQHEIRTSCELDGVWSFTAENGPTISMPVPGCWEQHPHYTKYRGKATYQRTIELTKAPSNLRLEFKGISHTADVFFDGKKIAHHYNAYTPFSVTIRDVAVGTHQIEVLVDNSYHEDSSLHIPNDYYSYGGITRGVLMEEISDVFIERIHFTPLFENGKWRAKIDALLTNISEVTQEIALNLTLADQKTTLQGFIEANQQKMFSTTLNFDNVIPWSNEQPHLYYLTGVLLQNQQPIDDLIERVGFRTVEIIENQLFINQQKTFIKGFNRHEDYGDFGCAIPFQLMVQDLDILQDLGANSIRTCHYPNDELFLDLCDERGLLVWEENHARGLGLPEMQHPLFDQQCADCNEEMVLTHYNHPSIIIWGILNECASETEEGREKYAKQYEQIRALDQTRPLTSATCRHFTDICLDLPDIVSFNMYTGWYQEMSVEERHEKEIAWINEAGGAGKPIIVSEFGAGGIYGYHDRARSKWSEERQLDILKDNLEVYLNDPRLMGVYIWQFADCRVSEENNWFAVRPRTHNNKGIVDEYRRPKLAYDTVKNYFEEKHS